MDSFEIEITHLTNSGNVTKFKKGVPSYARFFLKAGNKGKATEWMNHNHDTITSPYLCPFNCSGTRHDFNLKPIKAGDIPKDARLQVVP